MERKVIIDFFEQETPWNQTAVTLVTQTSYGRIDHLLASIKMWDGTWCDEYKISNGEP